MSMLKVNLEKELLKQRKAEVSAIELLKVKEYDRLGVMPEVTEVLDRLGVNSASKEGMEIKNRSEVLRAETMRFSQERVFHISQIKSLCDKYYLRFLPSPLFNGQVDEKLASKVVQTELAYGITLYDGKVKTESPSWRSKFRSLPLEFDGNTLIAAPPSSFKLQEKPKDPLFFYKINDEYYYLVHKWGDDLSIFRRLRGLLSSTLFCWLAPIITYFMVAVPLMVCFPSKDVVGALSTIGGTLVVFTSVFRYVFKEDYRLIPTNEYVSQFL